MITMYDTAAHALDAAFGLMNISMACFAVAGCTRMLGIVLEGIRILRGGNEAPATIRAMHIPCDEWGTPTVKMPNCPRCDEDELGLINPVRVYCYRCGWSTINGPPFKDS